MTFSSNGHAASQVVVTPFGVTTASSHDAFFTGKTSGDGAFYATNQTFGQSNGNSGFASVQTTTKSAYDNSSYKIVGAIGFVSFEGKFGSFGAE